MNKNETDVLLPNDGNAESGGLTSLTIRAPESPQMPMGNNATLAPRPRGPSVLGLGTMSLVPSPRLGPIAPLVDEEPINRSSSVALRRKATGLSIVTSSLAGTGSVSSLRSPGGLRQRGADGGQSRSEASVHGGNAFRPSGDTGPAFSGQGSASSIMSRSFGASGSTVPSTFALPGQGSASSIMSRSLGASGSTVPSTFALPPPASNSMLVRVLSSLDLNRPPSSGPPPLSLQPAATGMSAGAAMAVPSRLTPRSVESTPREVHGSDLDGLGMDGREVGCQTDDSIYQDASSGGDKAWGDKARGLWHVSSAPTAGSRMTASTASGSSVSASSLGSGSLRRAGDVESASEGSLSSPRTSPPANAVSASSPGKRLNRKQKVTMGLLVTSVCAGFGLALFLNGIAGRLVPPRSSSYSSPGTPMALKIIASIPGQSTASEIVSGTATL